MSQRRRDCEPVTLDPTLRLLALVALRDAAARAWVLAEDWARVFGSAIPKRSWYENSRRATVARSAGVRHAAFLATLAAAEEAAVSSAARGAPAGACDDDRA